MKKIISYTIPSLAILISLFFILEIFSFLGILAGIFPLLAYWFKDGIIRSDLSYSLFFLAFVFFYCFLLFRKGKVVLFNLSLILFFVGAAEKYLIIAKGQHNFVFQRFVDSPGWNVISDTLGYAPAKNFTDHCVSYYEDTLLFDVHYTTDEHGFRKTPPIVPDRSTKGLVFFGCSFTFGTGVNDNEVLPNIVQDSLKNKYKVYNFAYGGYGTHQMLANIEFNRVDSIVKYDPAVFIYVAISDHLNRALNLVGYGSHGPKFILDSKTNEVKYSGHFDDVNVKSVPDNFMKQKIINSELYGLFKKKQVDTTDVRFFVEMVKKSQTLLHKKYPSSTFHVIFWDNNWDQTANLMLKGLQNEGILTHKISDIVPDYSTSMSQYCVNYPHEKHPNGKVNRIIADFIVNHIVSGSGK